MAISHVEKIALAYNGRGLNAASQAADLTALPPALLLADRDNWRWRLWSPQVMNATNKRTNERQTEGMNKFAETHGQPVEMCVSQRAAAVGRNGRIDVGGKCHQEET